MPTSPLDPCKESLVTGTSGRMWLWKHTGGFAPLIDDLQVNLPGCRPSSLPCVHLQPCLRGLPAAPGTRSSCDERPSCRRRRNPDLCSKGRPRCLESRAPNAAWSSQKARPWETKARVMKSGTSKSYQHCHDKTIRPYKTTDMTL